MTWKAVEGSLRTSGVMRSEGGLLLLFPAYELLIQGEDTKASMVSRFFTSTVKRPLTVSLAA